MPVCLHLNRSMHDRGPGSKCVCDEPFAECQEQPSSCITIGLINNMADGALEATERQYLSLLDSISDGILIHLSLYSLPGIPRNEFGARHLRDMYSGAEILWNTHLDGLIVTGREPLTQNLADEPYWGSLTSVLEWAHYNTHSSIWSCLAAHAAVLHMDGIHRIKSRRKHCGVFECARVSDHPLTAGAPSRFALPHSRWNGVREKALTSHGYNVLTRAADAGVDTFVKNERSLFVFFQGHPEYESNTLLLEYRRDVGRFLKGETNIYPSMPRSYFDKDTVNALMAIQEEAVSNPRNELLAQVSAALENTRIKNTWQATAACIYRNWLDYICAQKQLLQKGGNLAMQPIEVGSLAPMLATAGDESVVDPRRRA